MIFNPHIKAMLLALLVTFLWSTSFVIIKIALVEIPPITFAGLRYTIAFFCLLPFVLSKNNLNYFKALKRNDWINLILLGILFYTFTQGAQFLGLSMLPAVTVSLWLNFTPLVVAVMAVFILSEFPSFLQWIGILLFISGVFTYFFPVNLNENQTLGLMVMTVGVLANASSAVLGRSMNRKARANPLIITLVSMGVGGIVLLLTGFAIDGIPTISTTNLLYLLWLSIINTALAFTIWNLTLKTLSAMESSIINGTMLIQIGILAYIFLNEQISMQEGIGMFIAAAGAILVQIKLRKKIVVKRKT